MTRIADADIPTFGVEGRLTHDNLEELRMTCEAALAESTTVRVELKGLRFVDPAAVSLLKSLEGRGATLVAPTGFVAASLAGEGAPIVGPPEAEDEAALVARLRRGDGDAFEVLVRRFGGRMLAAARRLVRDEDEARDVVQDALLSAFRAIDTFAGNARLSTWLHRVVVNAALMRLRTRRRRPEEPLEPLLPRFQEDGHWVESPRGWEATPEELLGRRDARAVVRRAIERLPETYRTVIVLRDIEDLDTDEAAAALGISPNALKIRLHRARQALRTLLAAELGAS